MSPLLTLLGVLPLYKGFDGHPLCIHIPARGYPFGVRDMNIQPFLTLTKAVPPLRGARDMNIQGAERFEGHTHSEANEGGDRKWIFCKKITHVAVYSHPRVGSRVSRNLHTHSVSAA